MQRQAAVPRDVIVRARAALRDMLPPEVAVAVWGSDVVDTFLFPAEEAAVARAVEKRRVEFARGRSCARAALVAAGGDALPIPVGPDRQPLFPDGFLGSITHCEGLVAAVAARDAGREVEAGEGPTGGVEGLGIDAERLRRLTTDILDLILTDEERSATSDESSVIFSAKEALFKAVFPITGVWLGFHDVALEVTGSTFTVARTADSVDVAELARLEGRWRVVEGLVLTACWAR